MSFRCREQSEDGVSSALALTSEFARVCRGSSASHCLCLWLGLACAEAILPIFFDPLPFHPTLLFIEGVNDLEELRELWEFP